MRVTESDEGNEGKGGKEDILKRISLGLEIHDFGIFCISSIFWGSLILVGTLKLHCILGGGGGGPGTPDLK